MVNIKCDAVFIHRFYQIYLGNNRYNIKTLTGTNKSHSQNIKIFVEKITLLRYVHLYDIGLKKTIPKG